MLWSRASLRHPGLPELSKSRSLKVNYRLKAGHCSSTKKVFGSNSEEREEFWPANHANERESKNIRVDSRYSRAIQFSPMTDAVNISVKRMQDRERNASGVLSSAPSRTSLSLNAQHHF